MREIRSSESLEGISANRDPYSDYRKSTSKEIAGRGSAPDVRPRYRRGCHDDERC